MEINFDIYGNLKPYELIEMEWGEFEVVFVHSFDEMSTRAKLFHTFETYITDLQAVIGPTFYSWVGGSFVTNKDNPKDIDIVTFIPEDIFFQFEKELFPFSKYGTAESYGTDLDAYLVVIYPDTHKKKAFTESDEKYWLNHFTNSRPNRRNKKLPKGFIQLSFMLNI